MVVVETGLSNSVVHAHARIYAATVQSNQSTNQTITRHAPMVFVRSAKAWPVVWNSPYVPCRRRRRCCCIGFVGWFICGWWIIGGGCCAGFVYLFGHLWMVEMSG